MRPGSKPPSSATVPASTKCQCAARDHLAPGGRIVAHRHHVLGAIRIEHRIGLVRAIGDRRGVRALVEDEVAADEAGDRLAVLRGDRHLHPHRARASGTSHCHPIHSSVKPWRIKRAVAELGLLRRIGESGCFLERLQQRLAAAVADLVEQPAVAAARIDRLQHVEVGAGLDLAARVARRELEIDDFAVARQGRIEAEVDLADELFVRTGGAERAAVQDHLAPLDAQPHDAGASVTRGAGERMAACILSTSHCTHIQRLVLTEETRFRAKSLNQIGFACLRVRSAVFRALVIFATG